MQSIWKKKSFQFKQQILSINKQWKTVKKINDKSLFFLLNEGKRQLLTFFIIKYFTKFISSHFFTVCVFFKLFDVVFRDLLLAPLSFLKKKAPMFLSFFLSCASFCPVRKGCRQRHACIHACIHACTQRARHFSPQKRRKIKQEA